MFYLVGGFDLIMWGVFMGKELKNCCCVFDVLWCCYDEGIELYMLFLVGNDVDDEGIFDCMFEFVDEVCFVKVEFVICMFYLGMFDFEVFLCEGCLFYIDWFCYNDVNVVF